MTLKQGFGSGSDGDQHYDRPTVADLSGLVPNPFQNQSQSGSNTLTPPPPFGAPGNSSEATSDLGEYEDEHPVTNVFQGPGADRFVRNTGVASDR